MRLRDLLDQRGVVEELELRSRVGFMALHGGSQDRGSDAIARRAAAAAGASYYAIVQPPSLRIHLPSHRHDPADSPTLTRFLAHVEVVFSVHGFGRDSLRLLPDPGLGIRVEPYGPPLKDGRTEPFRGVILGGRNRPLAARVRRHMESRLPDWRFVDEERWLGPLAGRHAANPVNLPPAAGVQIELCPGLRGIGLYGERMAPTPDDELVELVVEALAAAAREAGEVRAEARSGAAPA
ncbi:MAG TPA: poly-gamma-glutamate hydrolase family protein [Acidimicrobiales bacterium]|nr:poly-gamma-glutamate hydrolase family protein [Acidimicrobiales bacterium]